MVEISDNLFEEYWDIINNRQSEWDGKLFYGVKTTGIYCRPSCPSRRPRKSVIVFFDTCDEASAAGFRPCQRCRPDATKDISELAHLFLEILEKEAISTVMEWAIRCQVSTSRLRMIMNQTLGLTPREIIISRKMMNFKEHIQQGEEITSAQYSAGFGSSSRLYEKANRHLGMTPAKYRKGGIGVSIRYIIDKTDIGFVLIAATDRGVCFLQFGESENNLKKDLMDEYPKAELIRQTEELTLYVDQLNKYLAGDVKELMIPLCIQATVFRMKVWEALRRIPYGQTRSYSEVATAIGQPKAVRAVASACAANPVAIATPCHRVVHADGSISGYRWGIKRKEILLELEKKFRDDQ
ncbi:MAG: methylated-DNA--[protein]-cysteine S-methyltransferase [Leptolinea sp.]|nr:methylated-DNA--[protein]-cysteine S-methyltransferase [Leptolinea sp.]